MLRCEARNLLIAMTLSWSCVVLSMGAACAQGQPVDETAKRYQAVVMEVLATRLASDVAVDRGRVTLKTPISRTMKAMTAVVKASVPYYLEGDMVEFKRFRPRVKEALAGLEGWEIPPAPRGWADGEWTYFQVQGELEDVLLLVAMDIGVFANAALAREVQAREELNTDWTQLQGGSDPLDPMPLPDFGEVSRDESTLDGLGTGGEPLDGLGDEVAKALSALIERVEALERNRPSDAGAGAQGGFPNRGLDGGWQPGNTTGGGVPDRLPEQFTLQFPSGSAALGLSAEYGLNTLVEWMVTLPTLRALVTGHSDATGSEQANMELSRRRAQIVRYYLLERGIAADRVTAAHFGERQPEWGAVFDRRVEVRLFMD